jgi:hypothetical protein
MGAIVTININTDDPNYQGQIQQMAARLQKELGERVDLDVGVVNDQSMPDAVHVNRVLKDDSSKITYRR